MTLTISVIIPAIDEAAVIQAAVHSAQQSGANEVLVVDGGSRDDTVDLAQQAKARVVTSEPGRARQQNAGATQATGDVLLFLHADCGLPENGLQQVQQQLQEVPGSPGGYFHQHIDDPATIYRWIETGNLLRARVLGWAYGDQAIFVRSEVFRALNGFPDLPLMEDLYLMKRLKREGPLIDVNAPLTVSARRWKKRGTIRQTLRNWAMLTAVHLGVSPRALVRYYPRTT